MYKTYFLRHYAEINELRDVVKECPRACGVAYQVRHPDGEYIPGRYGLNQNVVRYVSHPLYVVSESISH